jgi:hypothetical protein
MSDLDRAALILAGFTAAFLLLLFAAWRSRRPRPAPAAPKMPKIAREPGESRFSGFTRKKEPAIEPVEMAPSRLARISRAALERPIEPVPSDDPDPIAEQTAEVEAASEHEAIDPHRSPERSRGAVPSEAEAAASEILAPLEQAPRLRSGDRDAGDFPAFSPAEDRLPETPAIDEATLGALAAEVERQAHGADPVPAETGGVRLMPQIPPRDPILRKSWMGGRPRLPAMTPWPAIDGRDGDFIAQIACADLPPMLWDGLGPRSGWLALFANSDSGAAIALHLTEEGAPQDPPHALGPAWFQPHAIAGTETAALAIRALPEWPVDLATGPAGVHGADTAEALLAADYDIADPAFHPFDWPSMLAMAEILESRILALPTDGVPPADASDELTQAIADAAEANRDAAARTAEIVAIIRESAATDAGFLPSDATAVMAALHAIRWTQVSAHPDPESGEDEVETLALPLTRHRPDGDLWVDAYRALLFDHARHAYCANPDRLSAPAQSFFEPLWQAMAAGGIGVISDRPSRAVAGFDPERDAVLLELPPGGLLGLAHPNGGSLVFAIRKADLAMGDFSRMRVLGND